MEDRMQDVYKVAMNPAEAQGAAVRTDALRRALDMRYVRTGDYVDGVLGVQDDGQNAQQADTYRGYELGRAALSQVRFGAQRSSVR